MLFRYFNKTLSLFAMNILQSVFIFIGFLLLILPGIYLSIAYALSMPLIVEKNLGIWQAMETSRRAVTRRWFKIFWLFILVSLVLVASIVPLFVGFITHNFYSSEMYFMIPLAIVMVIGFIWTIPMSMMAYCILYRTLFGVSPTSGNI